MIESHRFLIESKDVTVEFAADSKPIQTQAPPALIHIVLTNLVRNAFQHSASGTISIALSEKHIEVTNPAEPAETQDPNRTESSFGIGLVLLEKVCRNQGWHFTHQQQNGTYLARVDMVSTR